MACLRTARAHGHLHSATDAWGTLVSSARIKQGLVHQHCQVSKQSNWAFVRGVDQGIHLFI